jgi:hypothetical protein
MKNESILKKEFQKKDVLVLDLLNHKNFIKKEIFGKLMVELGLLKMV